MSGHDVERYELSEPRRYVFELERRDFLKVCAVTGAGLLVVATLPGDDAGAQPGADGPRDVAAWLHIDDLGRVTAYTGKVEIGQNIRTSLAQTIADELRVPLEAVSLVMGDTDLTPYDRGTFGSRTTPFMAPQLAAAAATAREMLIDQAAARWQVDRSHLRAQEGQVVSPSRGTVTYGELTEGQRLTGEVTAEPPIARRNAWDLRGASPKKVSGRDFVTGSHRYTTDLVRAGMLHGCMVRPPSSGATLVAVNDAEARRMPGVVVVRDGDFVGVVAPTERMAARAAAAVRCEWRERSGQPSAKSLFDYLRATGEPQGIGRAQPSPHIAGDVRRARATAARTFEASYRIPYIAHVPLEPRAALAEWSDGKLTVWTGTQRPFGVREELMEAFRLSEARVRVIVPDTGSAYGGKHTGEQAIEAARLARAAGRPVRLVWTRAEEFAWAYFRPAGVIDIRAAVDGEGRLTSWEFANYNSGAAGIRTPYDVPNQHIAFHPTESPLRQGSYRALAATANHYAREMHMDEMARALGADPVDFRLRHLSDPRLRAVLSAAAEKAGWEGRLPPGRARGIACGTEKGSYIAAVVEASRSGGAFTVDRLVVTYECGAIVNPDGVRNQAEGCIVQGLGGALFEAVDFADGRVLNGSLAQYRVPRFQDVPPIEIVLLDRRDLPSAGAGETPIVCVAPAIGSAARALGPVERALPVRFAPV